MDIPVPVPNTEVKHPRADDTPIRGKVGSRRLFLFKVNNTFLVVFWDLPAVSKNGSQSRERLSETAGWPATRVLCL